MPKKVFLIRHGISVANAQGLVCGQMDSPLSPLGLEQAKAMATSPLIRSLLQFPCYTSHLQRAIQTANALGFLNPKVSPDLAETNTGSYSSLKFDHVNELYVEFKHYRTNMNARYPDGETTGEMITRSWDFFKKVIETETSEEVVIVAHGGSLNSIANHLLGISFESFPTIRFENCKISCLVKPLPDSQYWCLESLNVS